MGGVRKGSLVCVGGIKSEEPNLTVTDEREREVCGSTGKLHWRERVRRECQGGKGDLGCLRCAIMALLSTCPQLTVFLCLIIVRAAI